MMTDEQLAQVAELRRRFTFQLETAEDIAHTALEILEAVATEHTKLRGIRQHYPAHELSLNELSGFVTAQRLLTLDEILGKAAYYARPCGIYFLILGDEVVYVGQSANVTQRISQHAARLKFTRYAFAPVEERHLDLVESLYIHLLRPRFNGLDNLSGEKSNVAPIPLQRLLDMTLEAAKTDPASQDIPR